ncbi:LytR/AlgR family response regulator transcription factor [Ulvibacter antarcticus]|uniref:LytTR family two component transcriptional regulator n=1 Tax=Ulvibacter antarcticus TaxID=442714 RepID=A0A3L9YAE0_9FLAO|nr:LytTR family transcriptional regulator DNA-binding domain-containing protein [Ulvibacter antarcticus]RMA56260.1 LytTR family two component transcriptional regulator [Ulvibacter antarcticus]
MTIRCIVVEDEPLATEVMVDFINQVPFLKLENCCSDAIAAMNILNEKKIDLIFLDIHLPKLKGLDFLSTLKNPPMIILTTAYHEFALKSYDYNVLDYLLKPIEFSRFMVAVQKAANQMNKDLIPSEEINNEGLFFTVNKKKARIAFHSIIYIESQRENIKIVTETNIIQTRFAISELEKQLPDSFLRIHRSYIVAVPKIDFVDAQEIEIRGKHLPIGRSYKNNVHAALGLK